MYTESQQKKILKSMGIICDTREKVGKNDHILNYFDRKEIPWRREKVPYGDYTFFIPKNEELGINEEINFADRIMVERKMGLAEISSNIVDKSRRIYRELAGAPPNKVLLIENDTYQDLVNGNYNTQFAPKAFWAALLSMWHQFNIPVIFMPDKRYTGQFIYGYFYYYLKNLLRVDAKLTREIQNKSLTENPICDTLAPVPKGGNAP